MSETSTHDVDRIRQQTDDLRSELTQLDQQIHTLQQALHKQQAQVTKLAVSYQDRISKLFFKEADLKLHYNQADEHLKEAQQQLTSYQRRQLVAQAKLELAQQQHNQIAFDRATAEVNRIALLLTSTTDICRANQVKRQDFQAKIQTIRQQRESLSQQERQRQQEFAQGQVKVDDLRSRLANLTSLRQLTDTKKNHLDQTLKLTHRPKN